MDSGRHVADAVRRRVTEVVEVKVAIIHTRYRQRGGEDVAVEAETDLLRRDGHEVIPIAFDNAEFASGTRMGVAVATVWNRAAAARVRNELAAHRPDVVHVHNTFPAASPAVFTAARTFPVVHTIHNYRWLCPAATLLRDGRVCEECVGRSPWRGAAYGCYGGSRVASAVVAATLVVHRLRRTLRHVDRFIALTSFARGKLLEAGFPAERVVIKPNFTPAGAPRAAASAEPFALYVGRLSEEKGIRVLAEAWRSTGLPRLEVIGDGPLRATLEGVPGVRLWGAQPATLVRERLAAAHVLVMPSIWYEGLPLVLIEALSAGLPLVVSDLGSLTELVDEGVTGWRVPAGDPARLAAAVRSAAALPAEAWATMSAAARARHAERYAPEANLAALLTIYRDAMGRSTASRSTGARAASIADR